MISSKEEFNNYQYKEVGSEKILSEIDLLEFYSFFKKYLKLILIATIFTTSLGFYKFKTSKKIWEGEFKIVLSTPNNQSGLGNSLYYLNFLIIKIVMI